jgi:hypothetical protein
MAGRALVGQASFSPLICLRLAEGWAGSQSGLGCSSRPEKWGDLFTRIPRGRYALRQYPPQDTEMGMKYQTDDTEESRI